MDLLVMGGTGSALHSLLHLWEIMSSALQVLLGQLMGSKTGAKFFWVEQCLKRKHGVRKEDGGPAAGQQEKVLIRFRKGGQVDLMKQRDGAPSSIHTDISVGAGPQDAW